MKETVNHPDHYGGKDNPYEAIKVIEAWDLGFHSGNAVKYIARCGKKTPDPLEDLKKAKWYIDRAIQLLEGETEDVLVYENLHFSNPSPITEEAKKRHKPRFTDNGMDLVENGGEYKRIIY